MFLTLWKSPFSENGNEAGVAVHRDTNLGSVWIQAWEPSVSMWCENDPWEIIMLNNFRRRVENTSRLLWKIFQENISTEFLPLSLPVNRILDKCLYFGCWVLAGLPVFYPLIDRCEGQPSCKPADSRVTSFKWMPLLHAVINSTTVPRFRSPLRKTVF